jgi:hypothetical protein
MAGNLAEQKVEVQTSGMPLSLLHYSTPVEMDVAARWRSMPLSLLPGSKSYKGRYVKGQELFGNQEGYQLGSHYRYFCCMKHRSSVVIWKIWCLISSWLRKVCATVTYPICFCVLFFVTTLLSRVGALEL